MAAGNWDIVIEQGAVFRRELTWTDDETGEPMDLSIYEDARMEIRREQDKTSTLFCELSIENGGIVLAGGGKIYLYIPATETTELDFSQAFHSIELIPADPAETIRFLEGAVSLSTETTGAGNYES